ncbi:TPA: hypothetical protein WMP85_002257, partial [Neisseria gonorrhoeae]
MSSEEEPNGEMNGPSWTLIGAALVVGVVVAMGVILSIQGLRSDDEDRPVATSSSSSSQASPTAKGAGASVCGLPGHESAGTVTRAPKATWRLAGSIAAPHVEGAGPGKIESDGFGWCHARTPTGAVVSAAETLPFTATNELRIKSLEKSAVPGPGRTAALKEARSSDVEDLPAGERVQIAGFRLVSYSDTEAVVDVAAESDGRYF